MKNLLLIILILIANSLYAHGMNELGPNKGYISMPGTFHTELVPNQNGELKIYLLDINFKGPMTEKSSVKLSYADSKNKINFECKALKDYFSCTSSKKIDLNKGKLLLDAVRNNVKATSVAEYQLPLSLK